MPLKYSLYKDGIDLKCFYILLFWKNKFIFVSYVHLVPCFCDSLFSTRLVPYSHAYWILSLGFWLSNLRYSNSLYGPEFRGLIRVSTWCSVIICNSKDKNMLEMSFLFGYVQKLDCLIHYILGSRKSLFFKMVVFSSFKRRARFYVVF